MSAPNSPLPWHAASAERLLARGLPQSLMIVSRLGDGLQQLCEHLAHQLLAQTDREAGRLLAAGNHPDMLLLLRGVAASGKTRSQITIDQIRSLSEFAYLAPLRARYRAAVIVPACRMNASAANALLKLLEEPPASMVLILGCEQPGRLPATVRSRCRRLQIPAPDPDTAAQWVTEQGAKNARELLELSEGAPLLACELRGHLASYHLLGQLCCGTEKTNDALSELEKLEPAHWLPWVERWAASGARLGSGLSDDNVPEPVRIVHERRKPTALAWLDLHRQLQELRPLAEHPVNKRLLLEQVCWMFARISAP